jgi:hypothetical protein
MKIRFLKHWNSLSEDDRKKAFKEDKLYQQAVADV